MRKQNNLRSLAEIAIDPIRFTRQVLRDDPWSMQEEILRSVATNPQTAVKACHSSGKTRIAAAAVLWWITRFTDEIAITTAPSWEQVEKLIWGEIHRAVRQSRVRFPPLTRTELRLGPQNYATGLSTNRGVNFQGFHSGHLLVVIDEAPGVDADIWEAIEGIRASGRVHLLALGNPTQTGGPFHAAFTSKRGFWRTFTIDAFDTPNFVGFTLEDLRELPPGLPESAPVFQNSPRPYLVNRRWVYEKYWTWGEQSPLWQARVRGQFPIQADDSLISLAWLEAANKREAKDAGGPLHAGIDVAGPGEDETVLIIRSGPAIIYQQAWSRPDPRGEVAAALAPFRGRLEEVNIDSAGIGHFFAEHFSDLDYPVNFVNVSVTERVNTEQFRRLKDQLYWGLRQRCEAGDIAGLTDELAIAQLASIRYQHNARGQVEIESKGDACARGVKSPDRAEAIMLAFADRTPGIMRYYQEMAEAAELGYRPPDNPPPPSVEGDEDDPGELMNIYLNERERLAKLRP